LEYWSTGVLVSPLGQKTSNFRNCHVIQENAHKSNPAPFALFHHSSTPLLQKVIKNGSLSPSRGYLNTTRSAGGFFITKDRATCPPYKTLAGGSDTTIPIASGAL